MEKTKVNIERVKAIAEDYILPFPYDPKPELTLQHCYEAVVSDYRTEFQGTDLIADDETLEQIIDEYFNL